MRTEPIATSTNLAYGAAGLMVIATGQTPTDSFVGAGFLMLMLGSGLFHGMRTPTGQAADEMAMYFAFATLNAHVYAQLMTSIPPVWHIGFWFVLAVVGSVLYKKTDSFIAVPSLVILMSIGIASHASPTTAGALMLAYIACIGIRSLGKLWHDEEWQGDLLHGLWHIATSITMYASWHIIA